MTNMELITFCQQKQKLYGGAEYPNYQLKITQSKKFIFVYWEYLDGECWRIDKNTLQAFDEHDNEYYYFDNELLPLISSLVCYMIRRHEIKYGGGNTPSKEV